MRTGIICVLILLLLCSCTGPVSDSPPTQPDTAGTSAPPKTESIPDETTAETTAPPPGTDSHYVDTSVLPTLQTEIPTDDEVLQAYEQAQTALTVLRNPVLDYDSFVLQDGKPYYRIRGVDGSAQFREYLLSSFSPEIVEELLSSELFLQQDGQLYAVPFSGLSDLLHGGELYRIRTDSDTRRTLIVAELRMTGGDSFINERFDCLVLHEFVYEHQDGRWVFTQYPPTNPAWFDVPETEKRREPSLSFLYPSLREDTPSGGEVVTSFWEMHRLFTFYAELSSFADRLLEDQGEFRRADGTVLPDIIRLMLHFVCGEEAAREYYEHHFGEMPPALPENAEYTVEQTGRRSRILHITAGGKQWHFSYEYENGRWCFTDADLFDLFVPGD